jgi:MSHA pilin protein MshD
MRVSPLLVGLHRRERGVTLIELVVSIVIIAIASSAILGVLARTNGRSADAMVLRQAVSIGEAYLEEITLKPFADPDGAGGEVNRIDFDDVGDYNGLVDAGARDQFGNAIPSLAGYTVRVAVVSSTALTGVPAASAKRIDVRVTFPPSVDLSLSAYKTQ